MPIAKTAKKSNASRGRTGHTLGVAGAIAIALAAMISYATSVNAQTSEPQADPTARPPEYMVIWRHGVWLEPSSVRTVARAPLVSHIMAVGLSHDDRPDYGRDTKLHAVRQYCREGGKRLIWSRWLFPGYQVAGFDVEDVYDPDYYIEQIQAIKREKAAVDAVYVGFDAEVYANSPLKTWVSQPLSQEDYARLVAAVDRAVEVAGKVDMIMPERKLADNYPYNALVRLAERIMSEHTYYDRAVPDRSQRPYHIFGAALGVSAENPDYAHLPLYTPKEILSRHDRWGECDGVWFYPWYSDERLNEIAHMLAEVTPEEVNWPGSLPGKPRK